jgi:cytochrome c oxidase subunit 4
MVLDSKQMEWASRQGLETAALKKAKVPIFGKWYFPDLPANVPLVNLSTGEVETFPAGFRAGAVLYVKEEDLKRAGIGPYKAAPAPTPAAPPTEAAVAVAEPVAVAAVATPAPPAATPATPAQATAAAERPAPAPTLSPTQAHVPAHGAPSHGGGHAVAAHAAHAAEEHAHPGPRQYVVIAAILCVITAVEVWVYYVPALLPYIFPILIVLSLVKFLMVVGWFMHLKFDHVSFAWYFGGGLLLALAIFSGLVMLQIATHGPAPGDGNAHVFPPNIAAPASAPKPAGGH